MSRFNRVRKQLLINARGKENEIAQLDDLTVVWKEEQSLGCHDEGVPRTQK